ncbi:unnamed protein product [Brachionus calyciflorus]|uniref:E3 ubiquitin-protein ligase n=1 Tax=Brachionus calyciflorus TaxID=104777 RepID=A0A813XU08_9BILA|nr:unnamed protein product [Brachionus calyciflorus]
MDNFMDEDDEEILTDNDLIDIDESEFMYGDMQNYSSEESNQTEGSSNQPVETTFNFTPEDEKLLDLFSLENHAKELFSKVGTGDLQTILHQHWKTYVPICFNALDTPTRNLIDTKSNLILLNPLEVYLANNLNSEDYLNNLKELDDPPVICGRVFKNGEPSYFCRDCGSDPTCVLCSACFRHSKHRQHKYIMMTSLGGGYCDCGDPEAWKAHPNCDLHMPKEKPQNSDDKPEEYQHKLPQDLIQRARELFTFLMEYVYEILSIDQSEELPKHLRPEKTVDDYVTMLYNDEIHSYEQVVNTLKKVLNIDDKKAFDYAAIVDKEGRSAIKRSKKTICDEIKRNVETNMTGPASSPLATKVFHHTLIAHQYFSEKILVWLQKISEYSKGLKLILCEISLHVDSNNTNLVEKLMLSDSVYWKSARTILHQFYISTFFMDQYWKKQFAILYTRNYKLIWKNHVKNPDDIVSLTDLTVQIFTVLSLSKYLIEKFNIIQTIMDTIVEHCQINNGKLSFQRARHRNNSEFKRAQFMLFDLKYCLTAVPEIWSDDLRKNFVNGFKSFIDFIKLMHGMDSLKRLTQQHIEYEPEWETSFNLLIKLQKSISSLIEWCCSDQKVYEDCFKYLLDKLSKIEGEDPLFKYEYDKIKFNQTQYEIIKYQVIRQDVSIHAPLSRILAAVYSKMGKFNLNYKNLCEKFQSTMTIPKVKALIEPSLRALILVAQTNAGFWKRNGFSLLSQVYFYANIKCRHEMFDRDILNLQMGASLMDPNEFLINLMHHYGIYDFLTNENFELSTESNKLPDDEKMEYYTAMSQDFIELIIYIFSERYDPNLSQIEPVRRLEREVIHQLCVSPMPHSDLVKNIYSENEKYTNELEGVLSRIATFKTSTTSRGVYELKEEYQIYYSPYFYHYSRSDKSKSEEYQLSLKKDESLKFFKPPRHPPLTPIFSNITHLLDCDVFIKLILCILRRQAQKSKLVTDGIILRILHLIGLALHEEQDDIDTNVQDQATMTYKFKFLEKSILNNNKKSSLFSIKSFKTEDNLLKILTDLIAMPNNEAFKNLAKWINEYSQKLLQLKHKIDQQKTQSTEEGPSSIQEEEKALKEKRKNEIAEKRRAKIMAQLNLQSKIFIEKNMIHFKDTKIGGASSDTQISTQPIPMECEQPKIEKVICIGPKKTIENIIEVKKLFSCILCQEEQEVDLKSSPMVLGCYVQSSRVLSKNRKDVIEDFEKIDPLFMKNSVNWGIHSSSCGHVMHASCWQKYVSTVRQLENRRNARYLAFDLKRNEYICPLCETIGNTVLPIFPNLNSVITQSAQNESKQIDILFEDWLDGLEKTLEISVKKELHDDKDVFIIDPCPLSTITKLMKDAVASNFKLLFENEYTQSLLSTGSSGDSGEPNFNSETINVVENFTTASFTFGYNLLPNDESPRMPVSIWTNCAYTIQVLEQSLRFDSKNLFGSLPFKQIDLLSNIVKQAAVYGITKHTESVRKSCLQLLGTCMPYKTAFFESKNLMDLDMFHTLVFLCLSMPNLYNDNPKLSSVSNGGINDLNIFKLVLIAHTVQIFLTKIKLCTFYENLTPIDSDEKPTIQEIEKSEKIYKFYQFILDLSIEKNIIKLDDQNEKKKYLQTPKIVYDTLKNSLMPFLRCSALFFSNLTGITTSSTITSNKDDLENNFDLLTSFLGVHDDLANIFDLKSPNLKILITSWLTNESKKEDKNIKFDYPIELNRFIDLPNDFVDLMSMSTSKHVCTSRMTSIVDRSAESATILCLVCGEMLCNQPLCCQKDLFKKRVGCCTAHTYSCSGKTGVFLKVSECQVLLLNLNYSSSSDLDVKGCYVAAPYLDDYGETDQGLRRGNPLRLCKIRYDKLYRDWLTHSLPEVVARQYQNQTGIVAYNWIEF